MGNRSPSGIAETRQPASQELSQVEDDYTPRVFSARWVLGEKIGAGGYADVFIATSTKDSSRKVAVKVMQTSDSASNEVKVMRSLQHPRIVRYIDHFEESGTVYLLMEYCSGGDLLERVRETSIFSEKHARDIILVVLEALKHCHDRNIVHCDLKPDNLLLQSPCSDDVVKISDFGMAQEDADGQLRNFAGSPFYQAPEILCGLPFGKPVDMWSLGVICFVLLGGYLPFDDAHVEFQAIVDAQEHLDDDSSPSPWKQVTDDAKDFIQKLLALEPSARLTVDEALNHPWFSSPESDLTRNSLSEALSMHRRFNPRRSLKACVQTVMLGNYIKRRNSRDLTPMPEGATTTSSSSAARWLADSVENSLRLDDPRAASHPPLPPHSPQGSPTLSATGSRDDTGYIPRVFAQRWNMGRKLSSGKFGTVYVANSVKDPSRLAAVKIMQRSEASKTETKILRLLKHPNVVRFIDAFESEDDDTLSLVMELCSGGDLFDKVSQRSVFSEKEARDVVQICLEALKHCHDANVCHLDLKPENLLLASDDIMSVRLADFGLSLIHDGRDLRGDIGTGGYQAPEILLSHGYGREVDLWAMGCITYILLGGYPPFNQHDHRSISRGRFEFHAGFWDNVSAEAKDFIVGLLTVDPRARLDVNRALNHPWFQTPDSDLARVNLSQTLIRFQAFHGRRKFRGLVQSIIAGNRLFHSLPQFRPRPSQDGSSLTPLVAAY